MSRADLEGGFLSVDEVASLLGLSKSTIYRYTSKKQIPHIKLFNRVLFQPAELTRWVNEHRVN